LCSRAVSKAGPYPTQDSVAATKLKKKKEKKKEKKEENEEDETS
jgi:ribosomal protein L12E/L44/L45/RPP1/RPP2